MLIIGRVFQGDHWVGGLQFEGFGVEDHCLYCWEDKGLCFIFRRTVKNLFIHCLTCKCAVNYRHAGVLSNVGSTWKNY